MLGKTLLVALVLIHTFSTHGAEVRTVRTAIILHIPVLGSTFFTSVLIGILNISSAADKILIRKVDKVGVKENDFDFLRRLFGAVGIDGNGFS